MTPLDRLTAVLADSRRYDDPFVKPITDDLALVLDMVDAAQTLAEEVLVAIGQDEDPGWLKPYVKRLRAALAAIEGPSAEWFEYAEESVNP